MPRVPIDYSKTIIYRIVCKDPTIIDCYVGATTDIKSRKYSHKSNCNNNKSRDYNLNVYTFIREHNGWDNFDMIEIEKYNAKDQQDQARRERYWLEYYKATLNQQTPSQTNQEYNDNHKEQHIEYNRQHTEQKKEYNTKYHIINKEQIKEQRSGFYQQNKERLLQEKKEYYIKNKENILEKYKEPQKEYYCKNKEQILEKASQKITCKCGSICRKSDITKHNKTKKHQSFVLNICSNNL